MTDMTKEEREHRGREAKRLMSEPLFADALTEIRTEAMLALAVVEPTDEKSIMRLQAVVRVTDEIRNKLDAVITQSGARDGGNQPEGEPDIR